MYIEYPEEYINVYLEDEKQISDSIKCSAMPDECFLICNATFPYAKADYRCPAGVYTQTDVPLDFFENMDIALERAVIGKLTGTISQTVLDDLSWGPGYLISSIAAGSTFLNGVLARDPYVDCSAFLEYIRGIASESMEHIGESHGEDEGGGPGSTSGYLLFWDHSPSDAIQFVRNTVISDIAELQL
jgi:hypothetical protein